ncbi:aminoacyl-histidine dipeptidase [Motilimonas pumila]|uniref:Cytosol non-specific dipeptidase n=1 Tax=Motilimonas pumila TaxID=2303987 RepID=A0A418YJT0_9GAMM|nr:aminoacyl-histidine dipeptidase [Motilimonas pumila]RJG51247.1 aminoacyl-histidine dipeptidase [Motilimonas pumila]
MSLSSLQPRPLWQWFETICSIPHPSKHEAALKAVITKWASAEQLSFTEDSAGNLIIKKPATPGFEQAATVALQAHLDMVPQKNSGIDHDFTQDPIQPYIDGDWVRAKDTTLGADNGIGMASCLALLASKDVTHGPLEVLLTADEEAGMSGAFGLQAGVLSAQYLINTDSEEEGDVFMGCAGGVDISATLQKQTQPCPAHWQSILVNISGLKGGHSGCDIHLGRANANKLLGQLYTALLNQCDHNQFSLAAISGGSLRNAIPREASMTLTFAPEISGAMIDTLNSAKEQISLQYADSDANIHIALDNHGGAHQMYTPAFSHQVMRAISGCINGLVKMSQSMQGVVHSSTNLGVITETEQELSLLCLARSLSDIDREDISQSLSSIFELAGAKVTCSGAYPGWEPNANSKLMQLTKACYQTLYNQTPNTMVIHAGLECGLFKAVYPNLDMVSFGPTIKFPHSPDEKVHIESVQRYWQLLTQVVEDLAKNDDNKTVNE